MSRRLLQGKKVAILTETEFIPEELDRYESRFAELGAEVHLMSRLWGASSMKVVSDVDSPGKRLAYRDLTHDLMGSKPEDYDAVLISANYTSLRLRYFETPAGAEHRKPSLMRDAPAVAFFAAAMEMPCVVKGALCHGLLLLTPRPELLRRRKVICHEVVMADVVNAGADVVHSETGVVIDDDLITGYSAGDVDPYIDAIAERIVEKEAASGAGIAIRDGGGNRRVIVVASAFGHDDAVMQALLRSLSQRGMRHRIATPCGCPLQEVDPETHGNDGIPAELTRPMPVRRLSAHDGAALVLVGGRGPQLDMMNAGPLHDLARAFDEAAKPIVAWDEALPALALARKPGPPNVRTGSLLDGRRVASPIPGDARFEYDVISANRPLHGPLVPADVLVMDAVGARGEVVRVEPSTSPAVRDGHLITLSSEAPAALSVNAALDAVSACWEGR